MTTYTALSRSIHFMLQVVNVMTIKLLTTTDDSRTAFKTCTQIGNDIEAVPTDDMSELQPKLVLNYDSTYLAANYVYIALFDRYYKIVEKTVTIGKRIVITCIVDAVMSWFTTTETKAGIDGCKITAIRNGGIGAPTKVQDSKLPIIANEQTLDQTVSINNSIGNAKEHCYIITVIGGEVNAN